MNVEEGINVLIKYWVCNRAMTAITLYRGISFLFFTSSRFVSIGEEY